MLKREEDEHCIIRGLWFVLNFHRPFHFNHIHCFLLMSSSVPTNAIHGMKPISIGVCALRGMAWLVLPLYFLFLDDAALSPLSGSKLNFPVF